MDYFIQVLVNGLITGCVFALMAAGLTLIFSVLKIVNFGHGVLYMAGGYASYYAIMLSGLPPITGIIAAIAVLFAFGVLFEYTILSPMYTDKVARKDEYAIIVTFALTLLFEKLAILIFGPFSKNPPSFVGGVLQVGPLFITYDRIVAAVASIVLLSFLGWFMTKTKMGHGLDAVSQSRDSAAVIGINPRKMYTLAFGLGSALTASAGALVGPIYSLSPTMGDVPDIQSFIIVVLGGMGSIRGAMVGGVLLGLVEAFGTGYFPNPNRASAYSKAFGALLLILTLLFRPNGLFGREHTRLE